ncbi:MAG: choice-of-anchor M domain-containing protein [Actinomycetaceae bacterium]|nr:choice-of-anchor M domain-containing protein [Actinomycetaceae bacterium]
MVDGKLDFLARDDRGSEPVWRHLEDIVFEVGDQALQTLPEDGGYEFTGASAGQQVWVVPQTQVAQVPWLGWSTQSPQVTKQVERGINLEYQGHQGQGQFTLFLQAGNFGAPKQLWSSATKSAQAVWVDLKTHTHANWVFTAPGVHLVKVALKAKLIDGTEVSVPKILRFAVGQASAQDAQQTQWDEVNSVGSQNEDGAGVGGETAAGTGGEAGIAGAGSSEDVNAPGAGDGTSKTSLLTWVALGLLAAGVLAGALAVVMLRRARQAEAAAAAQVAGEGKRENLSVQGENAQGAGEADQDAAKQVGAGHD